MSVLSRRVPRLRDDDVRIADFRADPDPEFLRAFHDLCRDGIRSADHLESLEMWEAELLGDPPPSGPRRHLLLATAAGAGTARRRVAGGLLFETYPESRSGLLSYVAVARDDRRRGLARALFSEAGAVLRAAGEAGGWRVRAVFAESLDPRLAPEAEEAEAWSRQEILARLGARILRVPYVAPPLAPGHPRARDLLLMHVPAFAPGDPALRSGELVDFLHEYYRAQGIADPATDPDVQAMAAAVPGPLVRIVELRRETPSVVLDRVSVALHFVSQRPEPDGASPATRELPQDEAFHSFEQDLVSHAFRDPDPFGSRALRQPVDAIVRMPPQIDVDSEGRTIQLIAADQDRRGAGRRRPVAVLRSRTEFQDDIVVDHLVLTNMELPGGAWNEYDLVKLIKLLPGSGDASNVAKELRFAAPGATELRFGDWLATLPQFPDSPPLEERSLRAATVLVVTGDDPSWTPIFGLISRLSQETDAIAGEFRSLLRASGAAELVTARQLKATEGVVCSLLNFGDIDHWELADALEPALGSSDYLLWLQKANLVCLTREDRITTVETTRRDVGASPYLLAPHAVLIHNEELLRRTRAALDGVPEQASRRELERVRTLVDANLRQHLLPNVFHYRTEREIFARGQQDRGLAERAAALERRLEQLNGRIAARIGRAQVRQELVLAFIFGLLSATAIGDIAVTLFAADTRWQFGVYVGSMAAVFLVTLLVVWRVGRH